MLKTNSPHDNSLQSHILLARAHGLSHGGVAAVLVLFSLVGGILLFYCYPALRATLRLENLWVWLLVLSAWGLIYVLLLDVFFSMKTCTRLRAGWRFPKVVKTAHRLSEPESRLLPFFQELQVEGSSFFVVFYQKAPRFQWLSGTRGTVSGVALINAQGEVINDQTLLYKAWLPLTIGQNARHEVAESDRHDELRLKHIRRHDLPHYKKDLMHADMLEFIKKLKLEKVHANLLTGIDDLISVYGELLTIFPVKQQWRKALGYDFGVTFQYEDGKLCRQTCQIYAAHLSAFHREKLVFLESGLPLVLTLLSRESGEQSRKLELILREVIKASAVVGWWAKQYADFGLPAENELAGYAAKLETARKQGLK